MSEKPSYESFNPLQPSDPKEAKQKSIRELNDAFRESLIGGEIVTTPGIAELGKVAKLEILDQIRRYSEFNEENDPYGEHDFGSFTYQSHKIYWKIDYYDTDLQGHSEAPEDAQMTRRVMTIMLAEEY